MTARHRQAALWRDLDRGLLRPHLPRHPGGLELRRAAVRRPRRCARPTSCSRCLKVAGARRAAGQDQRANSTRSTPTAIVARLDEVLAGSIEGAPAAAPRRRQPRRRRGPAANRALAKYATDLTAARAGRQDRPGGRPRPGDPPDRRHPDAPPAEQPDPHRRGRASARPRWSRASRCASPQGDVPPMLQERGLQHARRRPDAGRRQRQGRVREAAASR